MLVSFIVYISVFQENYKVIFSPFPINSTFLVNLCLKFSAVMSFARNLPPKYLNQQNQGNKIEFSYFTYNGNSWNISFKKLKLKLILLQSFYSKFLFEGISKIKNICSYFVHQFFVREYLKQILNKAQVKVANSRYLFTTYLLSRKRA